MNAAKNILYVSYDGMTDPLGQSQVLPYLAGLSAAGYNITILSAEKPEEAGVTETIRRICAEKGLRWQPLPYTRRPPVVSTMKDLHRLKAAAEKLHAETPFSMLHCRSYLPAMVGQWAKKKWGIPFIFDMRGFWADERVDGGLWPQSNPLYKTIYQYFKKKERQFFTEAAQVVSLTWCGKAEIESWQLPGQAPISVIPCCVDMQLFDPAKVPQDTRASLRAQLGIGAEQPVVGYVGSIGTWYLLAEMLAFFRRWLAAQPDAILLFVTPQAAGPIMSAAIAAGIPEAQVRITRAQRKEMPAYISVMDNGLFFIKKSFSKKASSPVKQGELMAMSIPVICNSGVGDSDKIVTDYSAGTLVQSFDDATYDAAIKKHAETVFDGAAIRTGCRDYFELQDGIERYKSLYKTILG